MPPPISFFFNFFKKSIYSKGIKLSVAVHSSVAEILICQLYANHFWGCQGHRKFQVGFAKNHLLDINSQIYTLHNHSGLILN